MTLGYLKFVFPVIAIRVLEIKRERKKKTREEMKEGKNERMGEKKKIDSKLECANITRRFSGRMFKCIDLTCFNFISVVKKVKA